MEKRIINGETPYRIIARLTNKRADRRSIPLIGSVLELMNYGVPFSEILENMGRNYDGREIIPEQREIRQKYYNLTR